MRSSIAFFSPITINTYAGKAIHGTPNGESHRVTKRVWHWAVMLGGSSSIFCGMLYYVRRRREAKRALDREQGILRLTAVTLSKATVKTVMTDHDVVKDLKQFGLSILKCEELKKRLKILVKERAVDDETKKMIKIFITKHLWKDMWIQEEVIGLTQYLANQVKKDSNLFPTLILSHLGSVAAKSFLSETFLRNLSTELKKVALAILRGPPQYSPWSAQQQQLARLRRSFLEANTEGKSIS